MKKFEYKNVTMVNTSNGMDLKGGKHIYPETRIEGLSSEFWEKSYLGIEYILNFLGSQGWELTHVGIPRERHHETYHTDYLFKKELEERKS